LPEFLQEAGCSDRGCSIPRVLQVSSISSKQARIPLLRGLFAADRVQAGLALKLSCNLPFPTVNAHVPDSMTAQEGGYDRRPTDELQKDVRGGVVAMTDRRIKELTNREDLLVTMKGCGDPADTRPYEVVAPHDHPLGKGKGSTIDVGEYRRPERRFKDAHHRKCLLGVSAPGAAALEVDDGESERTWSGFVRESREFTLQ
jgi:hypothetical protein